MKKIIHAFLLSLACFGGKTFAQGNSAQQHIQPKIMVMPRISESQDRKAVFDSSENLRIAIAKISEAFQKRNANLRDFEQVYRQAKENMAINKSSGNSDDFKSTVLQMSGADIYVETEIIIEPHTARNAKSARVILNAYQTGTSNSLTTRTVEGPMIQTDDIGMLVDKAMDTVSESFLNLLQSRFDDIVSNGQSVYVQFTESPGSKYNFDTEIEKEGKLLSEVIEDWFQKNAVHGSYNSQGVTGNTMIISDVRIPLMNPEHPTRNYTGSNFYNDIYKYFKTINIPVKREVGTNNKILITIL